MKIMIFKTVSLLIQDDSTVICAKGRSTQNLYSGIGGKIEPSDRSPAHAIAREVTEELFEVHLSCAVLDKLANYFIQPYVTSKYSTHVGYVMLIDEFEKFLAVLARTILSSPLYTVFPLTVTELVRTRRAFAPGELYSFRHYTKQYVLKYARYFTPEFVYDVQLHWH